MNDVARTIVENYHRIKQLVDEAMDRANRTPAGVTIVAVTKYAALDWIPPLIDAGCLHLGESRPQSLWQRSAVLPKSVQWHLIGHLQRNKIARTLPVVDFVHSVDSLRLLRALKSEISEAEGAHCRFLLEVNISGEPQKHGFSPQELPKVIESWEIPPEISVVGLMGMTANESSPDEARQQFALLRNLRDQLRSRFPGLDSLTELSMGMSHDFELAIQEGATMVRIGSALFEGCRASA